MTSVFICFYTFTLHAYKVYKGTDPQSSGRVHEYVDELILYEWVNITTMQRMDTLQVHKWTVSSYKG